MSQGIRRNVMGIAIGLLAATAGWAYGGEGKDVDTAGLNDPRSNAALNREQALRFRASGEALESRANRVINPGTVNNPAADTTAQNTQSETTIVNLGGGKLVAAYNDSGALAPGGNHFTGYSFSSNNGSSWTDGGTLPASTEGDAGDPVLAYDRVTGAVYLSTLGFTSGENIQVFKSTNSGQTWGPPVNGTPGFAGTGDFQDKEWMTVDNFAGAAQGNIYLCWTRFLTASAEIRFTRSIDDGASFGPNQGILISNGGQGCFVVVSPNHQVNVFYYRGSNTPFGNGGDNKLFLRRSANGGVSFGPEVQVADLATTTINGNLQLNGGLRSNSFPHAAVNPVAAKPFLYVVYNDDPTPANQADDNANVFYVRSTNGGTTWSAPVLVDGSARDQFFPTIGFPAEGGRPMIGYYNRSQDPSNLLFHRRARQGVLNAAGAIVLNPPFQLSPNTPVAVGQDPVINPTYMGDYDQISGGPNRLFSTWADNRFGDAFSSNQPDVFSATIVTPPAVANLSVATAAAAGAITFGNTKTLTTTVASAGGISRDVFVNLTAGVGLAFKSASVPGGVCRVLSKQVGCSVGTLAAGASKRITSVVVGLTPAGVRSVATVGSTSSRDTALANNSATTSVTVNSRPTTTTLFSTGNISTAIPDPGTVEIPLAVGSSGNILDIRPRLRINHTFDADLDLFLLSPTGIVIPLSTDNGGDGDNYGSGATTCAGTPTTFADSAATPITAGVPPFAGTFRPESPLNAIAGSSMTGTWKLRIRDDFGSDGGTIFCFQLGITR